MDWKKDIAFSVGNIMTKQETDRIYNLITSNGMREMEEERFHQAVNEILVPYQKAIQGAINCRDLWGNPDDISHVEPQHLGEVEMLAAMENAFRELLLKK